MNLLKKILSRTFLVVTLVAGILFLVAIFFSPSIAGPIKTDLTLLIENAAAILIKQEKNIVGLPVKLKIPEINVDSSIEYVGLTPEGAMDVPRGPVNVGWFDQGSRPGDVGSSVIAGHFGWKDNIPAVFDNLHELQKGDQIYLEDDRGQTFIFVVSRTQEFNPDADASEIFGSRDGKAHLNLITCQGKWSESLKNRPKRLVVFTDLEQVK